MSKVLIVDDEEGVCELLRDVLEDAGFEAWIASNAREAREILQAKTPDTILLDIRLPDADGIQLIEEFNSMGIQVPVILMTAFGTTETAIQAMKQGAHDYLNKPLNLDELLLAVQKAVKMQELFSEVATLREELDIEENSVDSLIGQSKHMQDVCKIIGKVADSDITVLIQGESGTGKELVARSIHSNGRRHQRPFIKINCGSIPEYLMESELFGHEKGAFTGAIYQKPVNLNWPTAERFFWTRLVNCRCTLRLSCCAYCRKRSSSGWAVPNASRLTYASSPLPTVISSNWWMKVNFAKISTTGSM